MDLAADLNSRRALRTRYLEYTLERGEEIISGGVTLFVRPKSFDFLPARIGVQAREEDGVFHLTLVSDCFAKSVCLSLREEDVVFSDNWLDLHGDRAVTVTARAPEGMKLESFLEQLEITSYCPSGIL